MIEFQRNFNSLFMSFLSQPQL